MRGKNTTEIMPSKSSKFYNFEASIKTTSKNWNDEGFEFN